MREFKYGVGVIAPNFLLNLLLVKMSEKSSTKADFWGKNQKDMSDNGSEICIIFRTIGYIVGSSKYLSSRCPDIR